MLVYNFQNAKEYGGFKINDKVQIYRPPYGIQTRIITRITVWESHVMIESKGEGGLLSASSEQYSHFVDAKHAKHANLSSFI